MKSSDLKNTVTLYRGDSSLVDEFNVDRTDHNGLLGMGIYLTDNPTVARDYTLKASEHVVFPPNQWDSDTYESPRELTIAYLQSLVNDEYKWEETKNQIHDKWVQRTYDIRDEARMNELKRGYQEELKKTLQRLLAKAKTEFRQRRENMRIVRDVIGSYRFVKADRDGYITRFEVPRSYINKTLHAETPLPDNVLAIVRDLFIEVIGRGDANRKMDMRDRDENFCTFDDFVVNYKKDGTRYAWSDDYYIGGNGENPTLDVFWNGTHASYHVFNEAETQKRFINSLMKLGYVGLEYEGGKRITGTGARGGGDAKNPHRAFVFWDEKTIGSFRIGHDKIEDEFIEDGIEKGIRSKM